MRLLESDAPSCMYQELHRGFMSWAFLRWIDGGRAAARLSEVGVIGVGWAEA